MLSATQLKADSAIPTLINLKDKYKDDAARFKQLAEDLSSDDVKISQEAKAKKKALSAADKVRFKEYGEDYFHNQDVMKMREDELKRLENERDAARADADAAGRKVAASQQRVDASQQRVTAATKEHEQATRELAQAQQAVKDSIAFQQSVTAQRAQLQQSMAARGQEIDVQQAEKRRLSDEENRLKNKLQGLTVEEAALMEQARTKLDGFTLSKTTNAAKPATGNNNVAITTGKKAFFN